MRLYGIEKPEMKIVHGRPFKAISLSEIGKGKRTDFVPFLGQYDKDADDYEVGKILIDEYCILAVFRTDLSSSGWIAKLSAEAPASDNVHGTVYVFDKYKDNVTVHSHGYAKFSESNSDWWEYLVTIYEPTTFIVVLATGIPNQVGMYFLVFENEIVLSIPFYDIRFANQALHVDHDYPQNLTYMDDKVIDLVNLI